MCLRNINYQEDYRTGYDDFLRDFLRPALQEAREYWRAVGFLSSSALEALGAPLGQFVKNEGSIRLVTSVQLSEQDIKASKRALAKNSCPKNGYYKS